MKMRVFIGDSLEWTSGATILVVDIGAKIKREYCSNEPFCPKPIKRGKGGTV